MKKTRRLRFALTTTTAAWCAAFAAANAQTSPAPASPLNLDIGSVSTSAASSYVAPSATGTLAQAVKEQQLAPNIVAVQPESVMRTLPDANVAENLQHIPGVSMESDSGFGRFVNIRGLAEDLNATQYAGIDLPATNTNADPGGGNRAVALDFLPPGVIGGAEVIATLVPSMSATGLGGVVNLLPPALPPDGKPVLDVTGAGGFSNLEGNPAFQGNITAGTRFAIPGMATFQNSKPFSFIGSYGYFNTSPGIYDEEESYTNPTVAGAPALLNNLQMRHYQNNRITRGYTGEFDFDPNNSVHLFVRGLHSDDLETIQKNELYLQNLDGTSGGNVVANGSNNFTATGANLNKYYENSSERVGLGFLEGGGKIVLDNFVTVDFHSAYAEGFDYYNHDYVTNYGSNDQNLTINYDTSDPSLRTYRIATANGAFYDPANPNNYSFSNETNSPRLSHDQVFDEGLSASVPTTFLGTFGNFELGGDARLRNRNVLQTRATLTPADDAYSLAAVTAGNPSQSDYNYYPVGPNLNYSDFFNVPVSTVPDTLSNIQAFQHDKENVYASFAQEDVSYGKLNMLVGLRAEVTAADYTAYGSTTDAAGNTTINATPTTSPANYFNLFPTVQLKYPVTNAFQLRAVYSTGIARPGFQQINPAVSTTFAAGQGGRDLVITGNPALQPQTGSSYDFAAGYYTQHDGLLEADLFLKEFSNYIVSRNINTPSTTFQTYSNINGASAKGIELQAVQKFYFLPRPLDGLGVDANLTYVDATADVHQGLGRSILPQSSPLTFNVTGLYQKGPVDLRLSGSYVSRNLFSVGADPSTDVFTTPRFRVDVSLGYDINQHLQFYFEGKNLTNTTLTFTQSASTFYPIQREFYGQDFLFGIHYKL